MERAASSYKNNGFTLFYFVFRKGEDKIVVVGDGEFGGTIKGFLEAMDDGDLVFDGFEKGADAGGPDVEEQGAAFAPADRRQGVGEAFKGLEHKCDFAVGDHGPVELAFCIARDRHREREAKELIAIQRCADMGEWSQ